MKLKLINNKGYEKILRKGRYYDVEMIIEIKAKIKDMVLDLARFDKEVKEVK